MAIFNSSFAVSQRKNGPVQKGGDLALGCGDCSQEPEGNEDEGAQKIALGYVQSLEKKPWLAHGNSWWFNNKLSKEV